MWADTIECLKCGQGALTAPLWEAFKYELPEGHRHPVHCSTGWCFSCKAFKPVEDLDPARQIADLFCQETELQAMQVRLEEFRRRPLFAKTLDPTGQEESLEQLIFERLEVLARTWLFGKVIKERISPERCPDCGSVETVKPILPVINRRGGEAIVGMKHPNCGGELVKRSRAVFVPKAVFPKQRIYSIEGEFLREEPEELNPEG
jgi:hypothetical protein